jgi:hypothetical protein
MGLSVQIRRPSTVKAQAKAHLNIQGAAEITPTIRRHTVGSPKQVEGCGPFR